MLASSWMVASPVAAPQNAYKTVAVCMAVYFYFDSR